VEYNNISLKFLLKQVFGLKEPHLMYSHYITIWYSSDNRIESV